jgi:ketosteroid isomerase-like protein
MLNAWVANDLGGTIARFSPDGVYALHIAEDLLPFGGETKGRDNFAAALRSMRTDWDYLVFRPTQVKAAGPVVRMQVEFMYRHRASGEVLSGRFRLVAQVEDGLVTRLDEYHDRAKVEAFMRLFGSTPRD